MSDCDFNWRTKQRPVVPESPEIVDFVRASGDCICDACGKKYYQHPMDGPEFDGHKWLHRICSGRLVKL